MKLERDAIARALARPGPSLRLHLFHGPDEIRSQTLAAQYVQTLAADGGTEVVELSPAQLKEDPARLADEAAAVSMFGDRIVIRVTGAGEESREAALLLLEAPAAGNPVVMVAGDLGRTSKLRALVEGAKNAGAIASYPPTERDALRETDQLAGRLGLALEPDARRALIDNVRSDLALAAQELEKLALYLDASPGRRRTVTLDHLRSLGADSEQASFSVLVDAVAGGAAAAAGAELASLGARSGQGIAALRSVARRMALLLELAADMEAGRSLEQVLDGRRPPLFWKERDAVKAQLPRWTVKSVRAALSDILEAERAIKRPASAGDILACEVLLGIAARVPARPARSSAAR